MPDLPKKQQDTLNFLVQFKKFFQEDVISRSDFQKVILLLQSLVVNSETKLVDRINKLLNSVTEQNKETSNSLNKKTGTLIDDFNAIKSKVNDFLNKIDSKFESQKELIQTKLSSLQNGKDADNDFIIETLRKFVPTEESVAIEITKSGERVRDSLELLVGEERLDKSAIKGLDEELVKIKQSISTPLNNPTGFVGRDIFKDIDISSQLDGVTKTFNIPAVYNIISVHTSSFPHALRKNIDFTYTGTTITFTDEIDAPTTLASGQTIVLTVVTA